MRQVHIGNKWVNGLPTDVGQRFRFMTAGGWQYGTYAPEPAPDVVDMRITKRSFFDRLKPEEEKAIDLAGFGETDQAAEVRRFIRRLEQSPFVDLSFQQTIDALNKLELVGLIAVGRANEILTAPINEIERYRGE